MGRRFRIGEGDKSGSILYVVSGPERGTSRHLWGRMVWGEGAFPAVALAGRERVLSVGRARLVEMSNGWREAPLSMALLPTTTKISVIDESQLGEWNPVGGVWSIYKGPWTLGSVRVSGPWPCGVDAQGFAIDDGGGDGTDVELVGEEES